MGYVGKENVPMIIGPDGNNLSDLLKHCGLDTFDRKLIQTSEKGMMHFGINKTDERLLKFKSLIQNIINNCSVIKLSAKEWKYLAEHKSWNMKLLQNEFTKCCISLDTLKSDNMLFYGSDNVKHQ